MELVKVLVEQPSEYARRVEQIGLLLRNVHALLNAIRPYQARATLKHLLEVRIKEQHSALEDVRAQLRNAEVRVGYATWVRALRRRCLLRNAFIVYLLRALQRS